METLPPPPATSRLAELSPHYHVRQTAVVVVPAEPRSPRAPLSPRRRSRPGLWLPPLLILSAALTVASLDYLHFRAHHRQLWTSAMHDRHAHFQSALSLALDLRHGNLAQLWHDFDAIRVWPPLHALLAGTVLLIGGPDYRLAVLPSLTAFVGTVLLGFLVARRAAPRGGNLAGCVAALLLLTSAPHRAFATDIMLESLGACLTLLVLYLYLVTVQGKSRRTGRALGLALTALFLAKYNYWSLVVFALVAAELTTRPRFYLGLVADAWNGFRWDRFCDAELRQPLNYLLLALLELSAAIALTGGTTIELGRLRISLHSASNLMTAAYGLLLLRLALRWRRQRPVLWQRVDPRARPLLAWHFWPAALWLLMPKRLGAFLWYMSLANTGETPQPGLSGSLACYWTSLTHDYGAGLLATLAVLVLIGLGMLCGRRLRPGGRVLIAFVLIAAVVILQHPNRKSRFLHTSIPVAWTLAGVGLAQLLHGRLTRRHRQVRPWLAGAALAGLGIVYLPALAHAARAPEGGVNLDRTSVLVVSDSYLPRLESARRAAILSNMPMKFLCRWTFLQRYERLSCLETEVKDFGMNPDEDDDCFERWVQTTPADTLVFIDVPPKAVIYEYVPQCDTCEQLRWRLIEQTVFVREKSWWLEKCGCIVSVWRRAPGK